MLRHRYVKFVDRLNITILILIHDDYTFFTGAFHSFPRKQKPDLKVSLTQKLGIVKAPYRQGKVKIKLHDNPLFSSKRKVVVFQSVTL